MFYHIMILNIAPSSQEDPDLSVCVPVSEIKFRRGAIVQSVGSAGPAPCTAALPGLIESFEVAKVSV